jgi:hypothetical protein
VDRLQLQASPLACGDCGCMLCPFNETCGCD